jgi:hypothetical protein
VKVVTGQRRDGMVEIVDGVAAGDLVVNAGQLKLRDGTPVSIAGAGKPNGGAASAKAAPGAAGGSEGGKAAATSASPVNGGTTPAPRS